MSQLIGEHCSCINQRAKQAIEWALAYHIVATKKELGEAETLLDKAKQELREITGRDLGQYGVERKIEWLKKEEALYISLLGEIIQLKACPEPAFKVI